MFYCLVDRQGNLRLLDHLFQLLCQRVKTSNLSVARPECEALHHSSPLQYLILNEGHYLRAYVHTRLGGVERDGADVSLLREESDGTGAGLAHGTHSAHLLAEASLSPLRSGDTHRATVHFVREISDENKRQQFFLFHAKIMRGRKSSNGR